ncbi:MAG: ATPase, T2SS/T4P/T4SS family, partial [Nanoarchaeota archaeon]
NSSKNKKNNLTYYMNHIKDHNSKNYHINHIKPIKVEHDKNSKEQSTHHLHHIKDHIHHIKHNHITYVKNDEKHPIKQKHHQHNLKQNDSIKPKESINATQDNIENSKRLESHLTKEEQRESKNIIEKYPIEVDGAKVNVEIRKDDYGIQYDLYIPKIDVATSALLENIRNELISITTVSMQELIDPSLFYAIKERFLKQATRLIKEKLPSIEEETEKFLVGRLIEDMLGLGEIDFLINDPSLEEIVIPSSKEKIRVYSKKYGWLETNFKIGTEDKIINYSNIIARRVGRQITVLNPLLDAHLVTGDRVNAVLYPINTKGNTITIRKFARDPFTVIDLINNKTCDLSTIALLWLAIEYEMNVLISGGTGSGKTSFLNACMPFIPPNQRIISIEDTRELMLPDFLYWTPLVTRTPNPEGKGEVSMLDLLINSLRMRPDRIILGEMRRQQEAMVLFEAMHTGHSVYATVHADTASETVSRLVNPPLSVPPNLLRAVNLNVVMFRDRRKGIRRIFQIAEFEAEKDTAKANILYRWSPEEDKIIEHEKSSRFFEDLARNTGMSQKEINEYLEEKKKILSWLIKNNIRDLNNFGKVMNIYYKNKSILINAMNKNDKSIILNN